MIQKGNLRAQRQGKSWKIDSESLPLSASERRALEKRYEAARQSVEAALEPVAKALGKTPDKAGSRYSVQKLLAFKTGSRFYEELCRGSLEASPAARPARQALFEAMAHLTQGCHAFRADEKAGHFREARRQVATATAHLFLCGDERGAEVAAQLEQELIPKIGGLVASQEKGRKKSSRFDRFGAGRRGGAR